MMIMMGGEREKNSIFHKMKMCIREEGTWQNGGDAIRMNVRARERETETEVKIAESNC